jgi:chemotaxis-related protein WspD
MRTCRRFRIRYRESRAANTPTISRGTSPICSGGGFARLGETHGPRICDDQMAHGGGACRLLQTTDRYPPSLMTSISPCWSDTGIWGRRTCPELKTHIHCRNCAAFARGATSLFERPVPPGYAEDRAQELAQEEPAESAEASVIVTFRVGTDWYALPVESLDAATGLRPWHRLPHRGGAGLLGIVNVNGDLLPCVSLHTWLASDIQPPDPQRRLAGIYPALLVFGDNEQRVAFPVDETAGITRITSAQLSLPPATVSRSSDSLIARIAALPVGPVGLLDTERLTRRVAEALQ